VLVKLMKGIKIQNCACVKRTSASGGFYHVKLCLK